MKYTQNTDQLQLTLSYFPALNSSQSFAHDAASIDSVLYFNRAVKRHAWYVPVVVSDLCWVNTVQ